MCHYHLKINVYSCGAMDYPDFTDHVNGPPHTLKYCARREAEAKRQKKSIAEIDCEIGEPQKKKYEVNRPCCSPNACPKAGSSHQPIRSVVLATTPTPDDKRLIRASP